MRILGVDPGLIKTGYGLIEADSRERMKLLAAGAIETSKQQGISMRVASIYQALIALIKEHRPCVLVLEKLYSHYKHPSTAILMGHARGVVCLACGINDVELISYSATRIKKAITGNGRASKEQVQGMVKSLLNIEMTPKFFDISDAIAMAISYIYIKGVEK